MFNNGFPRLPISTLLYCIQRIKDKYKHRPVVAKRLKFQTKIEWKSSDEHLTGIWRWLRHIPIFCILLNIPSRFFLFNFFISIREYVYQICRTCPISVYRIFHILRFNKFCFNKFLLCIANTLHQTFTISRTVDGN